MRRLPRQRQHPGEVKRSPASSSQRRSRRARSGSPRHKKQNDRRSRTQRQGSRRARRALDKKTARPPWSSDPSRLTPLSRVTSSSSGDTTYRAAQRSGPWLLLLAHGSRDPSWQQVLEQLQRAVQVQVPQANILLCYLQLSEPNLIAALQEARQQGATRALVIPVFLSGGGHLVRDVTGLVEKAAAAFPALELICSGALGEELEVQQGMVQAALRLLAEVSG